MDLSGEYEGAKFVIQCKNFSKDKVQISHMRKLIVRKYDYFMFIMIITYVNNYFRARD